MIPDKSWWCWTAITRTNAHDNAFWVRPQTYEYFFTIALYIPRSSGRAQRNLRWIAQIYHYILCMHQTLVTPQKSGKQGREVCFRKKRCWFHTVKESTTEAMRHGFFDCFDAAMSLPKKCSCTQGTTWKIKSRGMKSTVAYYNTGWVWSIMVNHGSFWVMILPKLMPSLWN